VVDPEGENKGKQITTDRPQKVGGTSDENITPSFFGFEWAPAGFANYLIPTPDICISENVELAQRKLDENSSDWGPRRNWELIEWTIDYLKHHPESLEQIFKIHPFLRKASPGNRCLCRSVSSSGPLDWLGSFSKSKQSLGRTKTRSFWKA
jgi:hypothetical protein